MNASRTYVSRGVDASIFAARFLFRPEVVFIELVPER
jgi:predicted MPP superfamily phosphohydrolase